MCRVVSQEGRLAHQHLVQDHSHRPPVAQLGVALLLQHLRGDVVGGAHQAVRDAPGVLPLLPPLQELLAVVGWTGAPAAVKVQVAGVHGVLSAVTCNARDCHDRERYQSLLTIVLVVFRVVGPPEPSAEAEVS